MGYQTNHEIFPYQESRVKDIILHEEFYPGGLFNDIALLVLEDAFILDENVDTICLAASVPRSTAVSTDIIRADMSQILGNNHWFLIHVCKVVDKLYCGC
uniref:Peptidase S1 domain-containing protein n=1 Tax=Cacopsylla melanoneura TaxID=428564 RepID=A0A8D8Z6U7_9HEMI